MKFYTIKNKEVNLTIIGVNNDIDIGVPGVKIEWILKNDCLFIPKFTFNFLEVTLDFIEQLGKVGYKTHQFSLNWTNEDGTEYNYTGYLEADVFDNANTGYKDSIELNGILDIEYLDNELCELNWESASFNIQDTLVNSIVGKCSITNVEIFKSFSEDFGWCATENLIDDDNQQWDSLKYITEICKTFNLVGYILNDSSKIVFYDRGYLATQVSIDDYEGIEHRGIDENINIGELIQDYTIKVSNYDRDLDLTPDMKTKHFSLENDDSYQINTSIKGKKNDGGVFHKSNKWFQYERILGYYIPEDFSGWSFPKYTAGQTITEIQDWSDPNQIFTYDNNNPILGSNPTEYKRYPKRGMYPLTYRNRVYDKNNTVLQGWNDPTDLSIIMTTTSENGINYYSPGPDENMVMMRYQGNINVPDNSVLLINYSVSGTTLITWDGRENVSIGSPVNLHEDSRDWSTSPGGNDDSTKSWGVAPVFIDPKNDADWSPSGNVSNSLIKWRLKFKNKYWNGSSWVDNDTFFEIPIEKGQSENATISRDEFKGVKNNNIGSRYTTNPGYEIILSGGGELILELVASELRSTIGFTYWHVFLKDLSTTFQLPNNIADEIRSREDTIYTTLTNTKHDQYKEDLTLMFHSDDNYDLSRSQIWSDQEMTNRVDTYTYSIGTFNISEKLEYHLIRWNTEYISGLKTISDIHWLDNIKLGYQYKGNNLWLNKLNLELYTEKCDISYSYNDLNLS